MSGRKEARLHTATLQSNPIHDHPQTHAHFVFEAALVGLAAAFLAGGLTAEAAAFALGFGAAARLAAALGLAATAFFLAAAAAVVAVVAAFFLGAAALAAAAALGLLLPAAAVLRLADGMNCFGLPGLLAGLFDGLDRAIERLEGVGLIEMRCGTNNSDQKSGPAAVVFKVNMYTYDQQATSAPI